MATKKESKEQKTTKKVPQEPAKAKTQKAESKPEEPKDEQKPKKTEGRNAKGQFAKGHKKEGGRKLGTKNKYGNVRDRLKEQIEPFLDQLGLLIAKAQLEDGAAAALTAIEKFLPYFTPKFSSVAIGADQDRPLSEEEQLMAMDAKYKKKELEINIKSLTVVNNDNLPDDFGDDEDSDFDTSQLDGVDND